ncbi:Hypothetical predicted protein [Paramuricea clavata]|uniref:Uncharacterized protein n=1 Tax=Paramuricea clavata TaxID=317549 RepID=A0A7D9L6J9_PARCT|nr:Hypothetical predicted protein [Paramuricea clavata]
MEGSSRISTTGVTARSSGISSALTSVTEIDQSNFDNDVLPVRTTTPIEEMVPADPWYMHLLSEWCDAWGNVRDLWRARDCWSKLDAILSLVCLPVRVIRRAASPHNNITIPDHASVCYLFLLMCYTFVLNLIRLEYSNNRRDTFVAVCMALAIPAMLYLYLFTKDRVRHDPCHDAPVRILFRGGLYVFGFLSIMNSIFLAYDEWSCHPSNNKDETGNKIAATAQFVKALFVAAETLFLGYFHKACFPVDTAFLQISLAHILGTNLALWFWTLCEEAEPRLISYCKSSTSLNWRVYKKYFYPIFVEYLILALSILYGLWMNLRKAEEERFCRFCKNCASCLYRSQNPVHEEQSNDATTSRRERYIPRCGFGIMIGMTYVAVFLVLMLLAIYEANDYSDDSTNYDTLSRFKYYCYGSVVMYLTMICACYIILASLRSPNNPQRIRSIDYDDVLLYISLMGILLLEGFHLTSKIITGRKYPYLVAVDICGTVQHLTQAVTLMSLSHYREGASHRNKAWICECILFLLLTNLAWWIEDSFYLKPELARPGEVETIEGIETYGTIVKPMIVGWSLAEDLVTYITKGINNFRKIQACTMLSQLLNRKVKVLRCYTRFNTSSTKRMSSRKITHRTFLTTFPSKRHKKAYFHFRFTVKMRV